MDQSISCKQIYCIYKHPLSILIHLKFQDKDGCSKNGSRELLFNLKIKDGGNIDRLLVCTIMDSRGLPIYHGDNILSCVESDDERIILGFKQLNLNIKSQFPIVQEEEREAITYLLNGIPGLKTRHETSDILDDPTLGGLPIHSLYGHVTGICSRLYIPLKFTSYNHSKLLSSLTQFQHLRSLSFGISENWDHQDQFYEELGDQLGSKLVHLELRSAYNIMRKELWNNQMFKFSTLKMLVLEINSPKFNPSFGIESYLINHFID